MEKRISLSTGRLQRLYGDREALAIAKCIGADAVDFDTQASRWDYRRPDSVYARSEDEICSYFDDLRRHVDAIGLEIGQTHGRIQGFKNVKEEDDALIDEVGYDGTYNMELNLACFGTGFEIETAEFSVKLLRHMLAEHYGR